MTKEEERSLGIGHRALIGHWALVIGHSTGVAHRDDS
jgi:hypothetical protein